MSVVTYLRDLCCPHCKRMDQVFERFDKLVCVRCNHYYIPEKKVRHAKSV